MSHNSPRKSDETEAQVMNGVIEGKLTFAELAPLPHKRAPGWAIGRERLPRVDR